jgi:hypothetical protein
MNISLQNIRVNVVTKNMMNRRGLINHDRRICENKYLTYRAQIAIAIIAYQKTYVLMKL